MGITTIIIIMVNIFREFTMESRIYLSYPHKNLRHLTLLLPHFTDKDKEAE